ncbi:MAG: helix-turn-helix transcriptional regulator [Clostridia bacterium]|nr:helix-turn-helix transcriptional regulator [Clostridia bacterium]
MKTKLSTRIYELRKEINLSQTDLAKKIGASQKAVDFWEKGINEPKASFIIALSKYFGVTADYILGLED